MITKIECPSCKINGSMSLVDGSYAGPYKCWKCKELFEIQIQGNKLISCNPLSQEGLLEEQKKHQEEVKRQQEVDEIKNRFRK